METENLIFNDSSKGKIVEKLCEYFPDIGITVLSEALVIKTVYLSDLSAFMVAAKDGQPIFVADLQGN